MNHYLVAAASTPRDLYIRSSDDAINEGSRFKRFPPTWRVPATRTGPYLRAYRFIVTTNLS